MPRLTPPPGPLRVHPKSKPDPIDREIPVPQRLHLVFGGELKDPQKTEFENPEDIHVVGMFPDYQSAYDAWKSEAQRTVDNAHMRYFIAHIHRLRDEGVEASPTEELGS
ncbi:hypothetical protein Jann_0401 [Jannaschia sp. CCS1]|nr:hypothetical protein Jann_0401 [Jannaschia sp. CCS1]